MNGLNMGSDKEFSKSDKDVATDYNFGIDHTFPFLDTKLSRLDNNCN